MYTQQIQEKVLLHQMLMEQDFTLLRSHFVRAQHRKAMLYDVTYTTDLLLTQCQRQLGQQDL